MSGGSSSGIDTWPRILAYLETEAESKAEVIRIAALLGGGPDDLAGENKIKVYARYGIDFTAIPELRF